MDSIWQYVDEIRPGGRMIFKPEIFDSLGTFDHFLTFLNLDAGVTFEFVAEHPNRHHPQKSFLRYQQYIDGIPIEGGGYVASGIFAPGTGPDGPGGPCSRVRMMVPYIANDINIERTPTLTEQQALHAYLSGIKYNQFTFQLLTSQLMITQNWDYDCNYRLVYKFTFINEVEGFAYVDANNGATILDGESFNYNHSAPTHHYGTQNLNNLTESGVTRLISPDLRVFTYQFDQGNDCIYQLSRYIYDSIPSTTNPTEWTDESDTSAYQAFFAAQTVLPYLDDLDVRFEEVHLMVGCNSPNARSHPSSLLEASFTSYGRDEDDKTFATITIVCHELGHGYINEFFKSTNKVSATVHEGIADMFGMFCDYRYNDTINWAYGYELNVGDAFPRDFSDPPYKCFDDFPPANLMTAHERATLLNYLFYLLVEGGTEYNAPLLDIQRALEVIIDGLPEMKGHDDQVGFYFLRNATLNQALENFGFCSDEFLALVLAWEEICIGSEFEIKTSEDGPIVANECEYFLTGSQQACWDAQSAMICLNLPDSIDHGVNPSQIRWTITGPGSADFESASGMQGNQQQGGICLKITSIPELGYYPRWYNVRVDFTTHEGPMWFNHRLLMIDCTGTKPDCETYHGLRMIDTSSIKSKDEENDGEKKDVQTHSIEIYDLLGRLHYAGTKVGITDINLPMNQILIIRYLDKEGRLIETRKTMKVY